MTPTPLTLLWPDEPSKDRCYVYPINMDKHHPMCPHLSFQQGWLDWHPRVGYYTPIQRGSYAKAQETAQAMFNRELRECYSDYDNGVIKVLEWEDDNRHVAHPSNLYCAYSPYRHSYRNPHAHFQSRIRRPNPHPLDPRYTGDKIGRYRADYYVEGERIRCKNFVERATEKAIRAFVQKDFERMVKTCLQPMTSDPQ